SPRGDPSKTGATQSSSRMSILECGRNLRNAISEGVVSTVSPIDRKRITSSLRTLDQSQRAGASGWAASPSKACARLRWRALGDDSIICRRLFIFDRRFVDQHHRNIITNRVNTLAVDAFQCAAVRFQLNFGATSRANQNFE